ncbi:MAG TPA: TIGR03066 family protein [Gemmata sp.]|nr:TIGR03066 family protein [Gemmata sp.]
MRGFIGAAVLLVLTGLATAAGQEKIDPKNLIGKWEPADLGGTLMIVEFTEKGTMSITVERGGKVPKVEGSYKLTGNTLEMALKIDGKEQKETVTVTRLTNDEFVGKDKSGKEEKMKKIKAKN